MPPKVKLATQTDFRGGLNLRSDPFELGNDESPDLLNVDIDPRGGVELRQGISIVEATIGNPNLWNPDESTAYSAAPSMTFVNLTASRVTTAPPAVGPIQLPANWELTSTAAAQGSMTTVARQAVVAGQMHSLACVARYPTGTPVPLQCRIDWYDVGGGFLSSTTGGSITPGPSLWSTVYARGTAPANAATAQAFVLFGVGVSNPAIADVIEVGGVHFSRGWNVSAWVDPTVDGLADEIISFGRLETDDGLSIMVAFAGYTVYSTVIGTNTWDVLGVWTHEAQFCQFKDVLYIVGHEDFTVTWDGTSVGVMLQTFNDNLAAPASNSVIPSKYITAFQGSMWVASTIEGGTEFPNRVRWSHPNFPADFRSYDFIDIDTGVDGDVITGIVPLADRLLIFKRDSIYAIAGTGPDSFTVYPVSRTIGAIGQNAIVDTDLGVFFFSWPEGVFLYDGKEVKYQFERIQPIVNLGQLPASKSSLIRLGWSGRRLWVSVPWQASPFDLLPPPAESAVVVGAVSTTLQTVDVNDLFAVGSLQADDILFFQSGNYGTNIGPPTAGITVIIQQDSGFKGSAVGWARYADLIGDTLYGWPGGDQGMIVSAIRYLNPVTPVADSSLAYFYDPTPSVGYGTVTVPNNGALMLLQWMNDGAGYPSVTSTNLDPEVELILAPGGSSANPSGQSLGQWIAPTYPAGTISPTSLPIFDHVGGGDSWAGALSLNLNLEEPLRQSRVFLLDPTLSKVGSWTAYEVAVGTMFTLNVVGQQTTLIGAVPALGRYLILEVPGLDQPYDELADGVTHIASHYTTGWFDLEEPAVKKRWRHPEFVIRSTNLTTELPVEVRKDYDSRVAARKFTLTTSPDPSGMLWGDPWGESWAAIDDTSPRSEVLRGPTLGQARAVQIKISGPAENRHWGLNAMTLKFIPRPVRN